MIQTGTGNLLQADAEALVNTVNTQGVMGKGLALQFKRAFPEVYREYERACRAGEVTIGRMHVVERLASPRFIIHFPTKEHWRQRSELEFIERGLADLVQVIHERRIRSVAIPPLGCGLGGLRWSSVEPRIVRALEHVPEVRVILFAPSSAPAPAEIVDRTPRPRMTPGRAALLALMRDYGATGYDYPLSLLVVQKLAYFMQQAGEPLRLEFTGHHYGPYSNTLWKVLRHLEGHYTRGLGDGRDAPETELDLLDGAVEEATTFLAAHPDVAGRLERVQALIDGFETPFGMELLATVHWVMAHTPGAASDLDQTIAGVHGWSARKANRMDAVQIRVAWDRLRAGGWVGDSPAPAMPPAPAFQRTR